MSIHIIYRVRKNVFVYLLWRSKSLPIPSNDRIKIKNFKFCTHTWGCSYYFKQLRCGTENFNKRFHLVALEF